MITRFKTCFELALWDAELVHTQGADEIFNQNLELLPTQHSEELEYL